jgi:hypothetical protein
VIQHINWARYCTLILFLLPSFPPSLFLIISAGVAGGLSVLLSRCRRRPDLLLLLLLLLLDLIDLSIPLRVWHLRRKEWRLVRLPLWLALGLIRSRAERILHAARPRRHLALLLPCILFRTLLKYRRLF